MKKAIIILSIVAVIGTAGYFFYKKEIDKLTDMDYEFVGISIDNLAVTNTVFNLKMKIISDSTLEAQVLDLDLDAYIDGKLVGKITENNPIIIPAKGYSIIDVKIASNVLEAGSNLMSLATTIYKSKDANLTLKGFAKIKSAFITFKAPIDYTESIKYLMS